MRSNRIDDAHGCVIFFVLALFVSMHIACWYVALYWGAYLGIMDFVAAIQQKPVSESVVAWVIVRTMIWWFVGTGISKAISSDSDKD